MAHTLSDEQRDRLKAQIRRGNRLRWRSKLKNLKSYPDGGASLADRVKYVLWDPEVGDFSFDIADLDASAQFLATSFDVKLARARAVHPAIGDHGLDALLAGGGNVESPHDAPQLDASWYASAA